MARSRLLVLQLICWVFHLSFRTSDGFLWRLLLLLWCGSNWFIGFLCSEEGSWFLVIWGRKRRTQRCWRPPTGWWFQCVGAAGTFRLRVNRALKHWQNNRHSKTHVQPPKTGTELQLALQCLRTKSTAVREIFPKPFHRQRHKKTSPFIWRDLKKTQMK